MMKKIYLNLFAIALALSILMLPMTNFAQEISENVIFDEPNYDAKLRVTETRTYFDINDREVPREIFVWRYHQGKVYNGWIPLESMRYNTTNNSWVATYSGDIYPDDSISPNFIIR